eukprot:8825044-Pyramimonas_sp.AAC.1
MAPTQNVSTEVSALSKLRSVGTRAAILVATVKLGLFKADDKFKKLGFHPISVHRQRKTCGGIGGQAGGEATGRKSFPFRIVVSRGAVSGRLESHQLKESDR